LSTSNFSRVPLLKAVLGLIRSHCSLHDRKSGRLGFLFRRNFVGPKSAPAIPLLSEFEMALAERYRESGGIKQIHRYPQYIISRLLPSSPISKYYPLIELRLRHSPLPLHYFGGPLHFFGLLGNNQEGQNDHPNCRSIGLSKEAIPTWRVPFAIGYILLGMIGIRYSGDNVVTRLIGFLCGLLGCAFVLNGYVDCQPEHQHDCQ
jgi:hypothetical protein